jgi:hypothetical protein
MKGYKKLYESTGGGGQYGCSQVHKKGFRLGCRDHRYLYLDVHYFLCKKSARDFHVPVSLSPLDNILLIFYLFSQFPAIYLLTKL